MLKRRPDRIEPSNNTENISNFKKIRFYDDVIIINLNGFIIEYLKHLEYKKIIHR